MQWWSCKIVSLSGIAVCMIVIRDATHGETLLMTHFPKQILAVQQ